MATIYLDTSALGRVLLGEPDRAAILGALGGFERRVSSRLLRIELCRLALREGLLRGAEELLNGVALIPIDEELQSQAETVPPASAATLDALHMVTVLRLAGRGQVDAVMTYDRRLAEGLADHGVPVLSPS